MDTTPTTIEIGPETMIPDLLVRHPECRAVLDRYGLHGCGGPLGPVETLEFFARTHGVPLEKLLRELEETVRSGRPPAPEPPRPEDAIYRRFFLGGIAVTLTAGATWGAWILWRIALEGRFGTVSIHAINAHGHAQIFGWVGLFVLGFAYQAFPRIWHTRLAYPRVALATFPSMLAGIVLRTAGMAAPSESWALPAVLAGGALELAAVGGALLVIFTTFARSGARLEPYVAYIFAGFAWFALSSAWSVWHGARTTALHADEAALLEQVATYQVPLRDLQIHGFALFMILGVSMRMLPALYRTGAPSPERARFAGWLIGGSVAAEVVLFLVYRLSREPAFAAFLPLAWFLCLTGILLVIWPFRLWRPFPESDRSAKFVRAAYAWLLVSFGMLLLVPLHQALSGLHFSHAYHGAIRHAITVGFISTMIMGFAAKVVPTLNGIDPRRLTALWGPFLLVQAGCFLRVSLQTASDWVPPVIPFIGVSGTLEVLGLAWWGIGLAALMFRAAGETTSPAGPPPERISPEHTVADVLAWYPFLEDVFVRAGFTAVRNPILRRTVARGVTLRQAATLRGVVLEPLLEELNAALERARTPQGGDRRFVPLESIGRLEREERGTPAGGSPSP